MPLINMSQPLALDVAKETWWEALVRRCSWAVKAFKTPNYYPPQISLGNGTLLNLENGAIVVSGDLTIHATGSIKFKADQHLVLQSGQTPEERPGYLHSIWLNPEYDSEGRPVEQADILEIEEFDDGNEASD